MSPKEIRRLPVPIYGIDKVIRNRGKTPEQRAWDQYLIPGTDILRNELGTAPQRGVPVWEALDEYGRRVEVRELCEFAASIERQGLQGVSIGETVSSLATSMRAKALDLLEREADKANANLAGPTVGFVVTTIVFLAYPLAQRISEAFGG